MLKKIFGGIRMTWPRLILFAVISGVITGLIALLVPDGSSFRQIAVTFEAWIVLAIIVVVNCDTAPEAACKTFVYFLISQPLVYLVQVPFNSLGFGLFRFYYPYWFYWTIATLPGAFIAWHIKRDDVPAALILSVALAMLIFLGSGYLKSLVLTPPRYLISTLFCFGAVPVLILAILHKRTPRLIASCIALLVLAGCLFYQFRGGADKSCSIVLGLDEAVFPVTDEWSVRLEDPENGTVSLTIGDEIISSSIAVTIKDPEKPAGIFLTDPAGKEYYLPAAVIKDGNGMPTLEYPDQPQPLEEQT